MSAKPFSGKIYFAKTNKQINDTVLSNGIIKYLHRILIRVFLQFRFTNKAFLGGHEVLLTLLFFYFFSHPYWEALKDNRFIIFISDVLTWWYQIWYKHNHLFYLSNRIMFLVESFIIRHFGSSTIFFADLIMVLDRSKNYSIRISPKILTLLKGEN